MNAIFKREFKSYFATPIGYIFLAVLYLFLGLIFWVNFMMGSPDLTVIFSFMSSIVVLLLPLLTMRLMSEDKRQKVDQALLTAPVKLTSIVLGKFLAALAVFAIGFAPTIIFQIIVSAYVTVNVLPFIYSFFGIILLGGALIAMGMFISSLTESTAISAILTLGVNFTAVYLPSFASYLVSSESIKSAINSLSFLNAFESFSKNLFSVSDIIYFLSFIAVFLFLCVRSLEKRRWS